MGHSINRLHRPMKQYLTAGYSAHVTLYARSTRRHVRIAPECHWQAITVRLLTTSTYEPPLPLPLLCEGEEEARGVWGDRSWRGRLTRRQMHDHETRSFDEPPAPCRAVSILTKVIVEEGN